jgi:hypothetical protein
MSSQRGADDAWWDQVYVGPKDDVPDTPDADTRPGTVDDWFDAVSGVFAEGGGPPTLVEDAVPPPKVPAQATEPDLQVRLPAPTDAEPIDTEPPASPLPPLPVRPPRIPAMKPDPRLVPPADAVEPVELVEPVEPTEAAEPEPTVALPHVGERPPTYEPEPTALPAADPDRLGALVPDTVLDGARYGTMTLRAASVRGDSARYRGDSRGDRLLTVRFGEGGDALLVVALAAPALGGDPSTAEDACRQLAGAIGRSRAELLQDLRMGAQDGLRYGLQRLTARAAVRLRDAAAEGGAGGALHAVIAPLDPTIRLRAGFGVGPGGLLLLGDEAWYDAYAGRRLAPRPPGADGQDEGEAARFHFRAVVPEPGDVLLLCSDGLVRPLREEPAVSDFLAEHWAHPHPPGTVDFLRHVQVRAKGYASDRTAAAIWED